MLTNSVQPTLIGTMTTPLVSVEVTGVGVVPGGPNPVAVTMLVVLLQWVTLAITQFVEAPTGRIPGTQVIGPKTLSTTVTFVSTT
jgi:hypothetical protein